MARKEGWGGSTGKGVSVCIPPLTSECLWAKINHGRVCPSRPKIRLKRCVDTDLLTKVNKQTQAEGFIILCARAHTC